MRRIFAAVLGTVALSACTVFGVRSGTEESAFTVIDRIGDDIEVRDYPPRVAAATKAEGNTPEAARSAAFRRLFDYISGENAARASIAMTTPVDVRASGEKIAMTVPVETTGTGGSNTGMRFYLPTTLTLATAPQPTDPAVTLEEVPAQTMAVLRFSGSTDEQPVLLRERELLTALEASSWQAQGRTFRMFYDPP